MDEGLDRGKDLSKRQRLCIIGSLTFTVDFKKMLCN